MGFILQMGRVCDTVSVFRNPSVWWWCYCCDFLSLSYLSLLLCFILSGYFLMQMSLIVIPVMMHVSLFVKYCQNINIGHYLEVFPPHAFTCRVLTVAKSLMINMKQTLFGPFSCIDFLIQDDKAGYDKNGDCDSSFIWCLTFQKNLLKH